MKVQSIGQNNYNYQTNQNSKNQPAFGKHLIFKLEASRGVDLPDFAAMDKLGLRDVFGRIMEVAGLKPPKMFTNGVFYGVEPTKKRGVFCVIDMASEYVQRKLATLPPDFEAKCAVKDHNKVPGREEFIMDVIQNDCPEVVDGLIKFEDLMKVKEGSLNITPENLPIQVPLEL